MNADDNMLFESEAVKYLYLDYESEVKGLITLSIWRDLKTGPKYEVYFKDLVVYNKIDLDIWINACREQNKALEKMQIHV